jgi:hypothetical protein
MTPPVIATLFVSLGLAIILSTLFITRYLSVARRASAALTADGAYRALTDEYRRLSDMAITAQEHTELKLTELTVQIGELQVELSRMQRILTEVD